MATKDIAPLKLYDSPRRGDSQPRGELHREGVVAVTAVMLGLIVALIYASVTGISSWSQLVVLGGIVLATIGVMIAIDPLRRG
jgi:protein-S-isoprenylcysteine O-methyltransferase Ste14